MNGHIKIDRKILAWEWYKNINTKVLFFHLLLRANWKDGRFEGKEIKRGSFVTSVKSLSKETALTEDEIRTALKHLETTGEITKQTTNKNTVISIVNYDIYQDVPEQIPINSQSNPKLFPNYSQTIPKPFPTNEEDKESKNGKKGRKKEVDKEMLNALLLEINISDYLLEHVNNWLEYKVKEKNFTYKETSLKTLLKRIADNARIYGDEVMATVINDSIASGYQGIVFERLERNQRNNSMNGGGIDWSKV